MEIKKLEKMAPENMWKKMLLLYAGFCYVMAVIKLV